MTRWEWEAHHLVQLDKNLWISPTDVIAVSGGEGSLSNTRIHLRGGNPITVTLSVDDVIERMRESQK
jgi:hypothetical protein